MIIEVKNTIRLRTNAEKSSARIKYRNYCRKLVNPTLIPVDNMFRCTVLIGETPIYLLKSRV